MASLFAILMALPMLLATPLQPRAGAPIATSIPSSCHVDSPLPTDECTGLPLSGVRPSTRYSQYLLYSSYYNSTAMSEPDTWTQCEDSCYGYGTPGTCKTALLAYNVTTPPGYEGTAGGVLSPTACFLYDTYAEPDDFVAAPEGEYTEEQAGNIYCDE